MATGIFLISSSIKFKSPRPLSDCHCFDCSSCERQGNDSDPWHAWLGYSWTLHLQLQENKLVHVQHSFSASLCMWRPHSFHICIYHFLWFFFCFCFFNWFSIIGAWGLLCRLTWTILATHCSKLMHFVQ